MTAQEETPGDRAPRGPTSCATTARRTPRSPICAPSSCGSCRRRWCPRRSSSSKRCLSPRAARSIGGRCRRRGEPGDPSLARRSWRRAAPSRRRSRASGPPCSASIRSASTTTSSRSGATRSPSIQIDRLFQRAAGRHRDLAAADLPAPDGRGARGGRGRAAGGRGGSRPATCPRLLTPIQRWWLEGDPVDPHHHNQSFFIQAPGAARSRRDRGGDRRADASPRRPAPAPPA